MALAYVLVLAIVSLEIPLGLSLRDRVDSEVRSQARSEADVLAATASDLLTPRRRPDLQRLAATAAHSTRGRIVIVDRRGRLLADSGGASTGADYSTRPEVASALSGRASQERRHSKTLSKDLLATAVPIVAAGRPAGAVRVTQGVDAVNRAVRRNVIGLILIGLAVLVMGLAAGTFIARQIARPLRRLQGAAHRVTGGELAARAEVEGSSEQRDLATAFNEMTERVERLVRSHQDFVADASHQLRTPLAGLRLRLEEAEAVGASPAAEEEIHKALGEVDRLAEVVEELLVLSRAGERDGKGQRLELREAAARSVERWTAAAGERGIELSARADDAGAVLCAPSDLDRILDVLLENAIHYSGEAGAVEVVALRSGIDVLDRGPGLAKDEEQEVFERFHRGAAGRKGGRGTGLGLPIAAELARAWGAEVTLTNRPGGGARAAVAFYRPFPAEAAPVEPPRISVDRV